MISRYALYDISDLTDRFALPGGLPKGVKPSYNVSPTSNAPVVLSIDGAPVAKLMQWGLMAKGAKDVNSVFRYKTYNIPSENIFSRHSWDLAIREKRCLVPANGFYLLNGSGKKQAYYARLKDTSLVSFAGVYNSWEDADGTAHDTFTILTTETTSDLPGVNGRMPLIVSKEDEARWLDGTIGDTSSLYTLLRPNPTGILEVFEVSPAVHSPKPNDARLIERI